MKRWQILFLTVCFLALFAGTSLAVTLTEHPAPNDYTNAVTMGTWCGNGIKERWLVTTWWWPSVWLPRTSSQQGLVISAKLSLQYRHPYYIKPAADTASILNAYGVDGLRWSNDVMFLTYCGLATNCFSDTPYSTIQISSATGGWQNVKVMLTNLTHTLGDICKLQTNYYSGYSDNWGTNVWLVAKSAAESTWHESPEYSGLIGMWSDGYYYYDSELETDCYYAYLKNISCKLGFCYSVTNFGKSSQIFTKCGALDPSGFYVDADSNLFNVVSVFDSQGASVSDGWSLLGTISDNNLDQSDGLILGTDIFTNVPAMPSWCAEPYGMAWVNGGADISVKGWQYNGSIVIHDWAASTNGFKYK